VKKRLEIVLLLCVLCITSALADNRSFNLNASLTFDNYGYLDSGKGVSTEYMGFRITPDWHFARNWGLKLGVGSEWAVTSNVTGRWEFPMHSTCNVNIALAPYYEFTPGNWFVDLGPVVGCRLRLPYMNQEAAKYLYTLSVGVGLDFRAGYMFNKRWGIYADLNAQYSVYDLLVKTYYPDAKYMAGCINASIGVTCNLYSY